MWFMLTFLILSVKLLKVRYVVPVVQWIEHQPSKLNI
jgi:hypothetical protein